MAFSKQFVVDVVKTHDDYYGWQNAVAIVQARWIITHSDFPLGEAVHVFTQELDCQAITEESYIPIENVTDADYERWVTAAMSPELITNIENHSLAYIKKTHRMASLTTHYQNPDMAGPPLV